MKKVRKTKFEVDIYDSTVTVAVHPNLRKAAKSAMGSKAFKTFTKKNGKRWFDRAEGAQFSANGCRFIVLKPDADYNTIAHEAFHICEQILDQRSIHHRRYPDEAWAYLMGYVVGETIEAFKRLTK